MTETSEGRKPSFLRFFAEHPMLGAVGSVCSVIGLLLAVYFFFASRERPLLTYSVNPAKAAVVRTGQTSRLAVQFDGAPLSGDVTAVQVAFWNAGKKPIRKEDILTPLVFRTRKGARIIEAKLRKETRIQLGMRASLEQFGPGFTEGVIVVWELLEHNDGGVVQIIYEGNEDVPIVASAMLVGQKEISADAPPAFLKKLNYGRDSLKRTGSTFVAMVSFLCAGLVMVLFLLRIQDFKESGRKLNVIMIATEVGFVLAFISLGVLAIVASPSGPPFGF